MGDIFYEGRENFPANETELRARLAAVEKLINNDENVSYVNINFVLAAGQLMQDCGLITENNLRFLSNAAACKNFNNNFRFPYNPGEGALRRVDYDNDVMGYNAKGKENGQRFYHGEDRHLELRNGQHYLFSNDWYNDSNPNPNKRQFYNWLAISAHMACKKFWEAKTPINPPPKLDERDWERQPSHMPIGEVTTTITDELKPDKSDDLSKVIALLKSLHEKVDNITWELEEIKKPWR